MVRHHSRLAAFGLLTTATLALASACTAPASYDRGREAWAEQAAQRDDRAAEDSALTTLGEHLAHADAHNPAIRAAAERWRAALERVVQADALPDPSLTFGYFLDEVETRTGPMDWRVGISQPIPWPGTLDRAGEVAAARSEATRLRLAVTRLEVMRQVRDAWHEYAYVHAAIEITRGHRDLLSTWEDVARIRYSTGLAPEADVIRAQVELGKLDDQVRTLEDLLRPVAARLNAALNRPPAADLPTPVFDAPPPIELDEQALLEDLPRTSPELLALQHTIDAERLGVKLANERFYPDLAVGLDYTAISSARNRGTRGSGDDALAVTAGFTLPLWRTRLHAAEAEAEARLSASRAEHTDLVNSLSSDLELALYRLRDAERRIGLYQATLVPKGQEAVQTTDTAYQAGDAGLLDLVDAERILLEFQLSAARARADRAQALARIERVTGVPLHLED